MFWGQEEVDFLNDLGWKCNRCGHYLGVFHCHYCQCVCYCALNGTNFQTLFYPTFFLLQMNPTYMKWILHLVSVKNITFKSSYNWFKIDADCQPFSHVQSHLNYYTVSFVAFWVVCA